VGQMGIEPIIKTYNVGEILFTLISLGFIMLILALVVWVIRSGSKRKQQLDRIEKKIDNLNK